MKRQQKLNDNQIQELKEYLRTSESKKESYRIQAVLMVNRDMDIEIIQEMTGFSLIAKNYLPEDKIKRLERTVSGFFDYIENVIENQRAMKMGDLAKSVNKFLSFNEYKFYQVKGKFLMREPNKQLFQCQPEYFSHTLESKQVF